MSASASKYELIQLIHRHLKEHGFHSAAEELQKQSPQNEKPTFTTLLDIYSSWLKSSKGKVKSAASKRTTPEKKQATPKKAAQKKKTDKTTKQPEILNKKFTSPKLKKGDAKATEGTDKSKKSRSPKKEVAVADGGEDSDSDSSLDVEKWKKLVQHMTDTDIAKINEFNAIIKPKRQRVRKPRAKPIAKSDAQERNGQESVSPEVNKTKKRQSTKQLVRVKTNQEQNTNVEAPVSSVISQKTKKEKRKAQSPPLLEPKKKKKNEALKKKVGENEDLNDKNIGKSDKKIKNKNYNSIKGNLTEQSTVKTVNVGTEQKKKKEGSKRAVGKNIDCHEEKIEAKNANSTVGNLTEQSTVNPANVESKPKKIKKKATKSVDILDVLVDTNTQYNTNDRVVDENSNTVFDSVTVNNVEEESMVKLKKAKKRKKDKTKDDGDEPKQQAADAKPDQLISKETSEKTIEVNNQDIVEIVPKKKKKKKEEHTPLVETDQTAASVQDISEQISVKKKSKKKKKETLEDLVSERTEEEQVQDIENLSTPKAKESSERNEASVPTSEQKKKKKEKKLSISTNYEVEAQLVPPSIPQTPSLSTKTKKNKSASDEITQAQGNASLEILESETPKKKKKKSSKTSETES